MIFLKLMILLLYIILLITLLYIVDFLAWPGNTNPASLVDPINLSIRQLRWLLHARGVGCYGAIEKKDLSNLVSASGPVNNDEVKVAERLQEFDSYDTVTFSTKDHFQTSMDNSDDIWLVQILVENQDAIMNNEEWKILTKHAHLAGIRTGQVHCSETFQLCHEFSFSVSQLIVSNHYKKNLKGIHRKHFLTRKVDPKSAFHWLTNFLQDSIEKVSDLDRLERDWLSANSRKSNPIQLIYFSQLDNLPSMFASLSAKFHDQIRFGWMHIKDDHERSMLLNSLNADISSKSFVCLTLNRRLYFYSSDTSVRNYLHFQSLNFLLQTFNPDVNSMFTWSIYLCNALALLSLVTTSGNILARIAGVLKSFFTYHAILLSLWLLLSSCQPHFVQELAKVFIDYAQIFATTRYASFLRHFVCLMSLHLYLIASGFLLFFCATFALLKKLKVIREEEIEDTISELLLRNENHAPGYNDISRRWVERLATPALWLQPLIPSDYIENLPVWLYSGKCVESSDSDTSNDTSAGTTSASPKWTSRCKEVNRGRSCSSTRRTASVSLKHSLLWSIRSCLRSRSPRFRRTSGPPEGMREDQSCSVCLENYKSISSVCGLPCGHVFHHDCILQWLHADRHCCPVCRWPAYQADNRRVR